jgi:hypothetical protein
VFQSIENSNAHETPVKNKLVEITQIKILKKLAKTVSIELVASINTHTIAAAVVDLIQLNCGQRKLFFCGSG